MDATPSQFSEADVEDSDDPPMHSCRHCSGPFSAEWTEYNTLIVDLVNVGAAEHAAREGCHMWKRLVECARDMHVTNPKLSLSIMQLSELPTWGSYEPYLGAVLQVKSSDSCEMIGGHFFGSCYDATATDTPCE